MEPDRPVESCLRRLVPWQVVPLVLLLVSCQSTTSWIGDQYYESGRYTEAEAALVEYLESSFTEDEVASRALFRLGVIYATPEISLYDPLHSIEILEKLISSYPESSYASEASVLRHLLLQSQELEVERREVQLQLEELESELARRHSEVFMLQKQLGVREGQITELQQGTPPLEAQIQDLLGQLEAKELELEQLDRLKAIDLEAPPPRKKR